MVASNFGKGNCGGTATQAAASSGGGTSSSQTQAPSTGVGSGASLNSCQNRCGNFDSKASCQCDTLKYNDYCADIKTYCPNIK